MLTPKYYYLIEKLQNETRATASNDVLSPFDLDDLGADSLWRRIRLWLTDLLLPLFLFLLRELWPIAKIGRFVIVTRESDVRDVLERTEDFETPFGREMRELAAGDDFILGVEGAAHAEQEQTIECAMGKLSDKAAGHSPTEDELVRLALAQRDAELVARLSNRFARALIRTSGGRIDVMKDFMTRVATETCVRYFGLTVEDPNAFAEWSMSISALLFADPLGDQATRKLALNGAARIRNVIDLSISEQRRAPTDSVIGRLLELQKQNAALTDSKIRAIMVGMIAGFIPTNTLAAGRILQELERQPDAMRAAIAKACGAAQAEEAGLQGANADKASLQTLLFEAVRLSPPLTPGQWRYARVTTKVGGKTSRQKTIPQGSVLMVATMSALRDRRRQGLDAPGRFMVDRDRVFADLAFGIGTHLCLGKYLAMAQITEIFMVLLSQPNLRHSNDTWGRRIRWVGPFPRRLDLEFDPPSASANQVMLTICAPVQVDERKKSIRKAEELRETIAQLGNPAEPAMRALLDETAIVHFASLSVIEAGDTGEPAPHVLLELNVDGTAQAAIDAIAAADKRAGGTLHAIFQHVKGGEGKLADTLHAHLLQLKTRPWGTIGLEFNGTLEFSVADIGMQDDLSKFARKALDYYMSFHAGYGSRAMQALKFIRMFIEQAQRYKDASNDSSGGEGLPAEVRALLREGARFTDYLIVPSRKRLRISDWKERNRREALLAWLKTRDYWLLALPVIGIALVSGLAIFLSTAGGASWPISITGRILLALIGGPATALAVVVIAAATFLIVLHYHEANDVPDDDGAKLEDIRKIARVENPPSFAMNHFMAVTTLKPGWFRKLTLAVSLWGIKQMVLNYFRPGFVLNMGTIHYAKWFRLAKGNKLIFQANYDGSWESYLEDFIMKAHEGQSAAWSNGIGFPRTRFLILDGARDGDRFKRWVRRQQVVAGFWYSRFPHLTTDQIRNNALIHDGLARASTDSAARAWLDCFGSIPRPDYALETDEIQSLVFSGQPRSRHATCALIRLPKAKADRANWLEQIGSGGVSPHELKLVEKRDRSCEISFGDHPFKSDPRQQDIATFVAFSACGLARLGIADATKRDGLATFPSAFNLGMANRGRTLGDVGHAAASLWRWADTDAIEGDDIARQRPPGIDALLLIYGDSAERCKQALQKHLSYLGPDALLHELPLEPPTERLDFEEGRATIKSCADDANGEAELPKTRAIYEHFGFRDGISQPVIRGTQRFLRGVHKRDIVEPGEFVLGYRNNQGYYPPTAMVRAESDSKAHLPTVLADIPSRFPTFDGGNVAARDFGRNGSFLVVRQLAQNIEGFKTFLETKVKELNNKYSDLADATGAPVTAEWLAAKMMGRWPDGSPLVERPGANLPYGAGRRMQEENNFTFGVDDPQGLHCPFGAHIRRANPRDSLQPEDPLQQSITNRHRLLRRGRTYRYHPPAEDGEERGLLFMCLCADLDRQFEFVQQSWIQSPSFHGLRDEPDPMVAWSDPKTERVFTIPTTAGPARVREMESFVMVRAGGYFFLPSRSSVQYLIDLSRAP